MRKLYKPATTDMELTRHRELTRRSSRRCISHVTGVVKTCECDAPLFPMRLYLSVTYDLTLPYVYILSTNNHYSILVGSKNGVDNVSKIELKLISLNLHRLSSFKFVSA